VNTNDFGRGRLALEDEIACEEELDSEDTPVLDELISREVDELLISELELPLTELEDSTITDDRLTTEDDNELEETTSDDELTSTEDDSTVVAGLNADSRGDVSRQETMVPTNTMVADRYTSLLRNILLLIR